MFAAIVRSVATPCSVKASGKDDFGRFVRDVVTNCDEICSHSLAEIRNINSSGNRSALCLRPDSCTRRNLIQCHQVEVEHHALAADFVDFIWIRVISFISSGCGG